MILRDRGFRWPDDAHQDVCAVLPAAGLRLLLVVALAGSVVPVFGTPLAAQPEDGERSAVERPGSQPSVGAVPPVVVLGLVDWLLRFAWSFTGCARPRSDVEYEPPPYWFVRFVRATGTAVALAGLALVVLGAPSGGL